jgi:hypothetical protein
MIQDNIVIYPGIYTPDMETLKYTRNIHHNVDNIDIYQKDIISEIIPS